MVFISERRRNFDIINISAVIIDSEFRSDADDFSGRAFVFVYK